MKDTNIIRQVMKNEITWIFMIVGGVWAFVTQIILPINTIQNQLLSLESQMQGLQSYDARITKNSTDITILQQQVSYITAKK